MEWERPEKERRRVPILCDSSRLRGDSSKRDPSTKRGGGYERWELDRRRHAYRRQRGAYDQHRGIERRSDVSPSRSASEYETRVDPNTNMDVNAVNGGGNSESCRRPHKLAGPGEKYPDISGRERGERRRAGVYEPCSTTVADARNASSCKQDEQDCRWKANPNLARGGSRFLFFWYRRSRARA